jgi:hypothetical protein
VRRKGDLPQKTCATCGRPFAWRKKWAENWDEVKYCSERCRRNRPKADADDGQAIIMFVPLPAHKLVLEECALKITDMLSRVDDGKAIVLRDV